MNLQNIRNRVLARARLVALGYVFISLSMLLVTALFETSPGLPVWLTAIGFMPIALLSVEVMVRSFLSPFTRPSFREDPYPLDGLRALPYVLTFLLYFYNFVIFMSGVFFEGAGLEQILEAVMLAMLIGAFLFFGFELATHPLAEANLLKAVGKPFPSFRWRILVTFTVFTIFPQLFIFLKLVWAQTIQLDPSLIPYQIGPTLIRVAIVMPAAGILLAVTILKPVRQLNRAMEKVESEDYSARLPAYSTDELGIMGQGFNRMVSGLREREKMRNALGVYVSPEIAERILTEDLKPGGDRTEATVLFTDLRNFTTFSEENDPSVVVELLNNYFERMVAAIEYRGGYVNKFIGDAILAVFGAPVRMDAPAVAAVQAAKDMLSELAELNEKNSREGIAPFAMGIGIHCGPVILGNVGSHKRLEYTVMGDTVNTASRIEGATKKLNRSLLISQSVLDQYNVSGDVLPWEGPWRVRLKGKAEPVSLYSPGDHPTVL